MTKGNSLNHKLSERSEEFRKIQLTGKASYVVYLPKKWLLNHGLKKGDQIAIKPMEDSLLLIPKTVLQKMESREKKKWITTVSSKDASSSIARKIISLYLIGYDIIYIKPKENYLVSKQVKAIKELIRRKLMGVEVLVETPSEITLQVTTGYGRVSMEDAVRRMFMVASSMCGDAVSALKELNKDLAQKVLESDDEVDRFNLYVVRQLKAAVQDRYMMREIDIQNPRECLGYRLAIHSVERIADHSVRMAENVLLLEKPLDPKLYGRFFEIYSLVNRLLKDCMVALLKRDFHLAENVISESEKVAPLKNKLINMIQNQKLSAKEASSLSLIGDSLERIVVYIRNIAEVTLNRTVESIESFP